MTSVLLKDLKESKMFSPCTCMQCTHWHLGRHVLVESNAFSLKISMNASICPGTSINQTKHIQMRIKAKTLTDFRSSERRRCNLLNG